MSRAGRLRTRLVLEEPVEVDDGAGGVMRSFSPVDIVWAEVRALATHETAEAASYGAQVSHRITLRAPRDLTPAHRLRDDMQSYAIKGFRRSQDGRFIIIEALLRIA